MPTYQNPGVYVTEAAFVSKPKSSNTSRSTAAFFGEASRGPSTATLVTSWSDYRTLYGDLSQTSDLGFAVYHYFANGGKDAYIVRVTSTSAAASAITVPYYPNGTGSASAVLFTADAISIRNKKTSNSLIKRYQVFDRSPVRKVILKEIKDNLL